MKILTTLLIAGVIILSLSECKKDEDNGKLENPFGLLQLGSDTSLADGRYVLRTAFGCSGFANMLSCDNSDEVLRMNNALYPDDDLNNVDTLAVWYVKKVRYISPDPDYALAFGYRIYQFRPDGLGYRFLSFTSFATPDPDRKDEVGDGGGASVKISIMQRETYPRDPPVPTFLETSNGPEEPETRYLFQFYKSKDNPDFRLIKAGGRTATTGDTPSNRWKFATGYWDEESCDGNALPLHARSEYSDCEFVDSGSRCYVDEIFFDRVD